MNLPPIKTAALDTGGIFASPWAQWFSDLWNAVSGPAAVVQPVSHFTTANRPTANVTVGWSGFDDTLGKPVWVKSLGPLVWVDGSGAGV